PATGDPAAIASLERRIAALEARLAQAQASGTSVGSPPPPPSGGARRSPGTPASPAAQTLRPKLDLEPFLQEGRGELFRDIAAKWAETLARVKERKISVHAWLRDGEPVAARGEDVLVAF